MPTLAPVAANDTAASNGPGNAARTQEVGIQSLRVAA